MDSGASTPSLVILPGLDGTGELLRTFVTALGPDHVVHVIGYPTQYALGYEQLAAVVRRSLPPDGHYVLLGESFGGPIAVLIAAARPPGLLGVALCSSFVHGPWRYPSTLRRLLAALPLKRAPAALLGFLLMGSRATPELRSVLKSALDSVSAAALRGRLVAALTVNVVRELKTVDVPVLYLRASRDRLVPPRAAKAVVDALPAARTVTIEGPHCLLQVAAAESAAEIQSFMASVCDATRRTGEVKRG